MRGFIFIFLLLTISFAGVAEDALTHFVIYDKNGGSIVSYAFSENPVVTFDNGKVNVKSKNMEISYDVDRLMRFQFASIPSKVTDIQVMEPFYFDKEALVFNNTGTNLNVTIYNLDGKIIYSKTINNEGIYSISTEIFPKGVYVVQVNDVSYKILLK